MTGKLGPCRTLTGNKQRTRAVTRRVNRFSFRALAGAACALLSLFLAQATPALARTAPLAEPLFFATSATPRRASTPQRAAEKAPARVTLPLATVHGSAPGQAGYVHYFVITHPDGELESQVGIELPGDLVAWSFPGLGVVVSPFMQSGSISANGVTLEVEHLYGIRPFRTEEAMRVLRRDLAERVRMWVEEKTPYCDEERPSHAQCLSCLGFVLRVLYPSPTRAFPALPADFKSARRDVYTTEDLLLYLTGVPVDAPRSVRLKRIEGLAVPENMREQLVRVANLEPEKPTAVARPRTPARSVVQAPKRVTPAPAAPRRGS